MWNWDKKDSFEALSSIVKINVVTVEFPPSRNRKKNMQGTAEAADVKNKFLQDVDGHTFQDFSYGPSLNRIVVF